jgi:uncharacterized protein (DUF1015 family)
MANFHPLSGFRPLSEELAKVAVKSSDFSGKVDMVAEMENNNLCYLNLTNAHYLEQNVDDPAKAFAHAKKYVQAMFEGGNWQPDEKECFYVYRQTSPRRSCTGIIGLADIEEYDNNTIKKHELTRVNSEHLIAELFKSTNVLGEPVLLGHEDNDELRSLLNLVMQDPADEVFSANKGDKHELWLLADEELKSKISDQISGIESLYIMDGHHRMAALSNLHTFNPEAKGRYFLANLVAESELHIGPFHRKVEVLDMNETDLFIELSHIFEIQNFGSEIEIYNPTERNEFGMLFKNNWYGLTLREAHHQLDVSTLEAEVLAPIFDIINTQTDPKLSFVKNIDELAVVQEMKDDETSILFTLFPCSFDEIQTVSEQGGIMPPKSTYIQPRSRPGLVIQKFLH